VPDLVSVTAEHRGWLVRGDDQKPIFVYVASNDTAPTSGPNRCNKPTFCPAL